MNWLKWLVRGKGVLKWSVAGLFGIFIIWNAVAWRYGGGIITAAIRLHRLGLANFFDAVSDGNNITHSKPDPEVFVKAAEMLGISAKNCLVVEDAVSGAEAGHRAGMDVACVGDASAAGVGEYNMASFAELAGIADTLM